MGRPPHAAARMAQAPAFRSHAPGIAWPAYPGGLAGPVLALLHQLRSSEWWTPHALRAAQRRQIHLLLAHAAKTVLHYVASRAGEMGRMVVTPLHNFAMPLIRYDIGDYAEVGKVCPCGRGLPVLARIMGRARNVLMLTSGERRWPTVGDAFRLARSPVLQYQLVQHAIGRVEAKLAAEPPLSADEEERLRRELHKILDEALEISITYHASIARSPSGKYEDFRSELAEA